MNKNNIYPCFTSYLGRSPRGSSVKHSAGVVNGKWCVRSHKNIFSKCFPDYYPYVFIH